MKHIKMFLLVAIMLIVPTMLFAQGEVDTSVGSIVELLTPLVVLGISALVKWVSPKLPGWSMLLIVTGLSAAVAWVTNMVIAPEMSWLMQFGYGMLAVVINQFYKQIKKV